MKKALMIFAALIAAAAMTSCGDKDNDEQIVGKWALTSYYNQYHDFTDENLSSEDTWTLPDDNYIGYDSAEFKADGTMRWHLNDRYVSEGHFDYHYREYSWHIDGDSLFVYSNTFDDGSKYAIKDLDNKNLVIEEYTNNYPPSYDQHHWEQVNRLTLKRSK